MHINQVGFLPAAPHKYVYISFWAGSFGGIDYSDMDLSWTVVRTDTMATVSSGSDITLRMPYSTYE